MDAHTRARIAAEYGFSPEAAAMLDDMPGVSETGMPLSGDEVFRASMKKAAALTIDPQVGKPWDQRTGQAVGAGLTPAQIRKLSGWPKV